MTPELRQTEALSEDRIDPRVVKVLRTLMEHGFEAYIVGGAVRDLLLGFAPKDYDIATSAHPEEVKAVFRRNARVIGRRFRLVHVYSSGRDYFEVSTFRREPTADERKGRVDDSGVMIWRDNAYGTLEQDAVRRDFTANAIFYNPLAEEPLVDLTGGVSDLQRGVVRAIGPPAVRLAEDPVRMLRALKLKGQYGFELEPELADALAAGADQISMSSQARLFEELLKVLAKPATSATFAACQEHGLLQHLWPRLAAVWPTPAGALTRQLLAERDRRVASGGYSRSRTLALATIGYADIAAKLGSSDPALFWEHQAGLERTCREAIAAFLQPYHLPRFLSARARDVVLMLPRFEGDQVRRKVLRHPEYRYARELFSLLCAVRGVGQDAMEHWPPAKHSPSRQTGDHRREKHVQRSHRKRWSRP